jgi:hypothetical protein
MNRLALVAFTLSAFAPTALASPAFGHALPHAPLPRPTELTGVMRKYRVFEGPGPQRPSIPIDVYQGRNGIDTRRPVRVKPGDLGWYTRVLSVDWEAEKINRGNDEQAYKKAVAAGRIIGVPWGVPVLVLQYRLPSVRLLVLEGEMAGKVVWGDPWFLTPWRSPNNDGSLALRWAIEDLEEAKKFAGNPAKVAQLMERARQDLRTVVEAGPEKEVAQTARKLMREMWPR